MTQAATADRQFSKAELGQNGFEDHSAGEDQIGSLAGQPFNLEALLVGVTPEQLCCIAKARGIKPSRSLCSRLAEHMAAAETATS